MRACPKWSPMTRICPSGPVPLHVIVTDSADLRKQPSRRAPTRARLGGEGGGIELY